MNWPSPRISEPKTNMARILIIDDDEAIRITVTQLLEAAGHAVVVADDGLAGMNQFRAAPCDLVLTDMVMPHAGLMAVRVLKEQFPGVPVIAMTGGAPFRLGVARDLGVRATLVKPFTAEQLSDVVTAALTTGPAAERAPTDPKNP